VVHHHRQHDGRQEGERGGADQAAPGTFLQVQLAV
jgi:hypothetical protein